MMYVIPRAGLQIVDPDRGDRIPAEGRNVPDANPYWTRRLRDGDVTKGTAPPPETRKAPAEKSPPAVHAKKDDRP